MAEIRVQIPDDFMQELKVALQLRTNSEVVQEAMTLLAWAKDERLRNRVILSACPDGTDVERLAMRSLTRVRPNDSDIARQLLHHG